MNNTSGGGVRISLLSIALGFAFLLAIFYIISGSANRPLAPPVDTRPRETCPPCPEKHCPEQTKCPEPAAAPAPSGGGWDDFGGYSEIYRKGPHQALFGADRVQSPAEGMLALYDLFLESSPKGFDEYFKRVAEVGAKLTEDAKRLCPTMDGYVLGSNRAQILTKILMLPGMTTVCETGFNIGTSAAIYLENPKIKKVYAFDMLENSPCKLKSIETLKAKFPGRLEIIDGNSQTTVPNFVNGVHKQQNLPLCDLVHVDGGHMGEIPTLDMRNLLKIAAPNAIIVFDDSGDYKNGGTCDYCGSVKTAWDRGVSEGLFAPINCYNTAYSGVTIPGHYYCVGRATGKKPV